jgi:hypothetical protein
VEFTGFALAADYEAVLRSISYQNTASSLATRDREVSVTVFDLFGNASVAARTTIDVRGDGPDYNGFNEIAAAGLTFGTAGADLFVFDSEKGDVLGGGGGGVDAFLVTELADTPHRLRVYDGDDIIDLSLLVDFEAGDDPLDFVRLEERGNQTTIEIDADGALNGAAFVEALTLTRVTGLDVQALTGSGFLYLGGPLAPNNFDPVLTLPGAVTVFEETTDALTAQATDQDGHTLTYSIAGGVDASLFAIDPASGRLTFKDAPDFEVPSDANGDNVYDVQLSVADGFGGSASAAVAITVADVGTFTGTGPDYTGYDEIAASGFTSGTPAPELYVLGSEGADIAAGAGADAFLVTSVYDTFHRVRIFDAQDILDLSTSGQATTRSITCGSLKTGSTHSSKWTLMARVWPPTSPRPLS